MKVVLLFTLLGLAVANHVPGHYSSPAFLYGRSAILPSPVFTKPVGRWADVETVAEPMMVVARTSYYEPELSAILVERGFNYMPETMEGMYDVLRVANEEMTVCNADNFGSVDMCVEQPISKVLVPVQYRSMPTARLFRDISELPWMLTSETFPIVRKSISNFEVFDKPILAIAPMSEESLPITAFSQDDVVKSVPLVKSFIPAERSVMKTIHLTKALPTEFLMRKPYFVSKYLAAEESVPFFMNKAMSYSPFAYAQERAIPIVKSFPTETFTTYHEEPLVKSPVIKSFPVEAFSTYHEEPLVKSPVIKSFPIETFTNFHEEPLVKTAIKPFPVEAYRAYPEEPLVKSFITPLPVESYRTFSQEPLVKSSFFKSLPITHFKAIPSIANSYYAKEHEPLVSLVKGKSVLKTLPKTLVPSESAVYSHPDLYRIMY